MAEPTNAQLAAILRSIKGVMYTADAPTDDKPEILPYIALAAQRLEGEITDAQWAAAMQAYSDEAAMNKSHSVALRAALEAAREA